VLRRRAIKLVWFKWIISITLIYIFFVYLVGKFLTNIRGRYKNLKSGGPAPVKEDQSMDKANCEVGRSKRLVKKDLMSEIEREAILAEAAESECGVE
jgi:hypothetical protein